MKRGLIILAFGLAVAAAAYACSFFMCTSPARALQRSPQPELAWLKDEFKLSDSEFQRISELHAAYLPRCAEMCKRIDAQNARLEKLLAGATNSSPEIEAALQEGAQLRAECQTTMLRHFFQVSQTMPAEQGQRYMAWVKEKVFAPNEEMRQHH
jgi:hypothetical protein